MGTLCFVISSECADKPHDLLFLLPLFFLGLYLIIYESLLFTLGDIFGKIKKAQKWKTATWKYLRVMLIT